MTTLKTVEEIVYDIEKKSEVINYNLWYTNPTKIHSALTQDRQATADVLCALLEKAKKDMWSDVDEVDYNQALTLAQDIIRATLSK